VISGTLPSLLPRLIEGAGVTIWFTLVSAPIALLIAIAAGLARLSPQAPLRALATGYVELFRGTSLLVQLFYLFYVLPLVGIYVSETVTGIGALALNFGAYGSEVVRGAILDVPKGQIEAAVALHMPPSLAMRRIVIPQAARLMLPPFGNLLIELLKATSLLSLITVSDLAFAGNTLAQTTGQTETVYELMMAIYFLIAIVLSSGMKFVELRFSRGHRKIKVS
jgi:polar amino acid transport system permease protein